MKIIRFVQKLGGFSVPLVSHFDDSLFHRKIYHAFGWAIDITKIQEDVRNNQTNYFFNGIFGFGEQAGTDQDVQYKIVGTFQKPSGNT